MIWNFLYITEPDIMNKLGLVVIRNMYKKKHVLEAIILFMNLFLPHDLFASG